MPDSAPVVQKSLLQMINRPAAAPSRKYYKGRRKYLETTRPIMQVHGNSNRPCSLASRGRILAERPAATRSPHRNVPGLAVTRSVGVERDIVVHASKLGFFCRWATARCAAGVAGRRLHAARRTLFRHSHIWRTHAFATAALHLVADDFGGIAFVYHPSSLARLRLPAIVDRRAFLSILPGDLREP